MRKIFLYNHGGSENHGCEALVRTVCELFKEEDIILYSEMPQQDLHYGIQQFADVKSAKNAYSKLSPSFIKAYYSLKKKNDYFSIDILPYRKTIKEFRTGDIEISVGGDIYCYDDYPKYIQLHQMICQRGCKTILLGCSLNEKLFNDPKFVEDMKLYDYISARESLTYELLKKAGLKSIGLSPDSAFTLPKEEVQLPSNFIENNTVGINVSPLVMEREQEDNVLLDNYRNLIAYILNKTDYAVALIPHVIWSGNDDRSILNKLYDEFKKSERIVVIQDCNCMQLKGYIAKCRFFVGARTHATIAAYSTEVPTLVVGYSIKSRGIAKDIFGREENYVIPIEQIKEENKLTQAFIWLQENENHIKEHLKKRMPQYIKDAENVKEKIKEFF
ncbi:MAG: polysaccharide pyruvyl transferase family protein [Dorea longicatena]|jgi:colanic acid/amylovoran biosynthesis protein